MTLPKPTDQELVHARAAAVDARRARAGLKQRVKKGEISVAQAVSIAAGDDVLARIRVVDLLMSVPHVGEVRARRVMERLGIAPNRHVGGLGRLQIAALAKEFGE